MAHFTIDGTPAAAGHESTSTPAPDAAPVIFTGDLPVSMSATTLPLSGRGVAGTLGLVTKDGTAYFLWVDAAGHLRLGTEPPTADGAVSDTSGTVVGPQS